MTKPEFVAFGELAVTQLREGDTHLVQTLIPNAGPVHPYRPRIPPFHTDSDLSCSNFKLFLFLLQNLTPTLLSLLGSLGTLSNQIHLVYKNPDSGSVRTFVPS